MPELVTPPATRKLDEPLWRNDAIGEKSCGDDIGGSAGLGRNRSCMAAGMVFESLYLRRRRYRMRHWVAIAVEIGASFLKLSRVMPEVCLIAVALLGTSVLEFEAL